MLFNFLCTAISISIFKLTSSSRFPVFLHSIRSCSRSIFIPEYLGGGGEKDHVRIATIKSDFALLLKYYSISPLFIWIVVNILESFFVKKKKKKEMHPYPCINNGRCHNSPPCSSSLRARPGLPVIPLNSLLLSSLTSPAPAV